MNIPATMLDEPLDWFFVTALFLCTATFISWIVFARLSMARIERKIMAEGHPRPCPWDGPGARTLWYAWAITVPVGRLNPANDPLIDVPLVLRHATRADRMRGWALMVSGYSMLAVILIIWFAFDI